MQTTSPALLFTGLLYLTCLSSGLWDAEEYYSGISRMKDHDGWLDRYRINLVNYVAEVGTNVTILSPLKPAPNDVRWFSLNIDGELPDPVGKEVGLVGSTYLHKFQKTYNTSWHNVFKYDKLSRSLIIQKVQHGYADLFRVFVEENVTGGNVSELSAEGHNFDVGIALMTFEKHECGFTSKPQTPKRGDTLTLSCSVIVNGLWNASLVFRNNFGENEFAGETKKCGLQPDTGSKICSTVKVKAETGMLAYSCRLEFPPNERHDPKNPLFKNSKWTAKFNKETVCNFHKIYFDTIPSEVTFLCNNMPCGNTASVNDTVTCSAYGYPQPVFDLRIRDASEQLEDESESEFFMVTAGEERDDGSGGVYDKTETEIKVFAELRVGPRDVGQIEIICNVSNVLGWGYDSLFLEVKLDSSEIVQPGKPTFKLEDYNYWRKRYRINLVNYVAEVGKEVIIQSPIMPAPIGIHWFSQNMLRLIDQIGGDSNSTYLKKFQETYNNSWQVFELEQRSRWLKIKKVLPGYADVFRVFLEDSSAGIDADRSSFDVAITLITYEKHECGFASNSTHPAEGDIFVLNCSVIINGPWNASFVFRNNYNQNETRGEISECDSQPNTGSKICSTVKVKAETDILSYSCLLAFPSNQRQVPENPAFQNSKWTDKFNEEVVCYLPQVYLEVVPSDVMFLCNNMPCGNTASVGDTVTCVAYGYPQPVFDLRVQHFPAEHEGDSHNREFEVNFDTIFFMDTADESTESQIRSSENYRISQKDLGDIEISCNVSNALGWGYNSLPLEVKLSLPHSPRKRPGTFRLEDHSDLQQNYTINLVNYVAEVGTDVIITPPLIPPPINLQWFSLNLGGPMPHNEGEELSIATSNYLDDFRETYNTSWFDVFEYEDNNRFLKIHDLRLGFADVYRVTFNEDVEEDASDKPFDVSFTLTAVANHLCGFTSRPQNPKMGDTLMLSCSIIVSAVWKTNLIFRNNYDQNETIGQTRVCGQHLVVGSQFCSTVNVKVDTDILAYSCRLELLPFQETSNALFQTSQWNTEFNQDFECFLPKLYVEAIPSEVTFLCNNMPCGDTVLVNDTVTCLAHGYPQPVFDLRIQKLNDTSDSHSGVNDTQELEDGDDNFDYYLDTADQANEMEIKGSEDYRIRRKDVGQVEITCNVSNALGSGYNSMFVEVELDDSKPITQNTSVKASGASTSSESFTEVRVTGSPQPSSVTRMEDGSGSGHESGDFVTPAKDPRLKIFCNEFECGENHTLFVNDAILCRGVESEHFRQIVLKVNETTVVGDEKDAKYILQTTDNGEMTVECTASLRSGHVLYTVVHVIARGKKTEQGEAAGGIGLELTNKDSGAGGKINVPKGSDGMSAEKAEGDDKSKRGTGAYGQESFVLLELVLVIIGVLFGQGQF